MGRIESSQHKVLARALILTGTLCFTMPMTATAADHSSPAALSDVVAGQAPQLAAVDSNTAAMTLFTSTIGPSIGLKDTSGILSAKGLSAKAKSDLGLAELSQSAHELVAALAAWRLAESIYHAESPTQTVAAASPAQRDWLSATTRLTALADFFRLADAGPPSETSSANSQIQRPELLVAAHRLTTDAQRQALAAWSSLHEWKDRVRQARGLARLCGTWQWIIHNHHNHQEQKMTIAFPPAGQTPPNVSIPAEAIVLGDSIYLRWEERGYVQEDSLLFVTEGHKRDEPDQPMKLEGSFANNTGGWGPINAKRIAKCQP
ncbi:MAG: hypothetical protein FJ247_11215 [Nitrospira sp.]|nr:hypothetical protein [Nitrospira sp.]